MLPRTRITRNRDLLGVAVVVSLLGCGGTDPDPNEAPSVRGDMPDQLMTEGDTVSIDVKSYFTDPDGDSLTYTAVTSSASVLSASVSGSRLTLIALAPGEAAVTVTAADPGGLKATQEFDAMVEHMNRAPVIGDSIPEQVLDRSDTVTVDLASHFTDPDDDVITYEATSSNELLLTVSVSQDELTLAGVRPGTVTVSVTATDPEGLSATQDFNTIVEGVNHAPEVVDTMADASMEQDEYVVFQLSSHFSDPDDDPLTHTTVPSDTLAVSVSINGDTLRISSGAPDGTTVEVTATDPSGLSATQTPYFAVDEGFSEDFTDLDTLQFWRVSGEVAAELSDDGLEVVLESGFCGHAFKRVRSKLSEWWTVSAEIGREDSLAATYVMVGTDHPTYEGYRLLVGSGMRFGGAPVNYRFDVLENGVWIAREGDLSDELDDLGYEMNEVALEYSGDGDTLVARVDTLELVTLDLGNAALPTVATGETGFGVCTLSGEAGDGATAIVESGFLEGGYESGAPARPRAAEPSPAGFVLPGLPQPPHHLPALQPQVLDRVVHRGPALPVNGLGIRSQFQQCRKRHRIAQRRDMQRRPAGPCRRIHVRSGSHQQFQHGRVRVG